uniref:Uncharacterized protein n=1 Tax=Triticum urartu TaxID=4572 RepID=A0A8R7JYJ3_TRIUA
MHCSLVQPSSKTRHYGTVSGEGFPPAKPNIWR